MKKLLLLASVLLAAVGANAASKLADLGHVIVANDPCWPYDGFNSTEDVKDMGFGVKLPATMVSNYAGCKIIGFRVGWASPENPGELNLFLREGSFNGKEVASQKATVYSNFYNYKDEWNEVKLDTPYDISENPGDLYMGFTVDLPAATPTVAMSTLGNKYANSCYMSFPDWIDENGERVWVDVFDDPVTNFGPLLLVAIVEIPDGVETGGAKAQIRSIYTSGIQKIGQLGTAHATIHNVGTENLNSIKLSYSIGDKSYTHDLKLGSAIVPNQKSVVYIPSACLATGNTRIEITEINGKPNKFKQDITYPMLAVPAEVANKYTHRPVVEYFGSEGSHQHPYIFDGLLWPGYLPHADEVSLIAHHISDQFMTGDDEDNMLAMMISDNAPQVGYPSVMYDRQVVCTDLQNRTEYLTIINSTQTPQAAEIVYNEVFSRPTFLSVNVKGALNEASDELKVNVSGYIEPNILPEGEKLYISLYVLEDYVESTAQDWSTEAEKEAYNGVMVHQAIIRQRPTKVFGDVLTESGDYSVDYTIDLDPEEWKLYDMKVVALIHRGPYNTRVERQVLNCGEASLLDMGASIVAVAADGTEAIVSSANGQITVNGSTEGVKVYSLSGAATPNSGLRPGIYLVATDSIKTKVIVK